MRRGTHAAMGNTTLGKVRAARMNGTSRFLVSSVGAVGLMFVVGQVSAVNLILNPGFETGDTTDWSVLGASDGSAYVNVQTPDTARQRLGRTTRICTM